MGTTAHDAAAFILGRLGSTGTSRLHTLLYYSQGWSLAWDHAPLFPEEIHAFGYGPMVPSVLALHRGRWSLESWEWGDADNLSAAQAATVDAVLEFYGRLGTQELGDMVRDDRPYVEAREGVRVGQPGGAISLESARTFFSELALFQ